MRRSTVDDEDDNEDSDEEDIDEDEDDYDYEDIDEVGDEFDYGGFDDADEDDDDTSISQEEFRGYCDQLRLNDPSVLPWGDAVFKDILRGYLSEAEYIEVVGAPVQSSTAVTTLLLYMEQYMEDSTVAIGKYLAESSKHLEIIYLTRGLALSLHQRVISILLTSLQVSSSLKKLSVVNIQLHQSASQAFESLLTHTKSLQKLQLKGWRGVNPEELEMLQSGFSKNTPLRELTLISWSGTNLTAVLTSLRDHPLLQKLSSAACIEERIGLNILLHSGKSKITDLTIDKTGGYEEARRSAAFGGVLQTLGRKTTLTKLSFLYCPLYMRNQASQLEMVLRRNQGLESLDLTNC
jgi:hypothetical protein